MQQAKHVNRNAEEQARLVIVVLIHAADCKRPVGVNNPIRI